MKLVHIDKIKSLIMLFLLCNYFALAGCSSKEESLQKEGLSNFRIAQKNVDYELVTKNEETTKTLHLEEIKDYIGIEDDIEKQSEFSVAIIDSGIFPHETLKNKIIAFHDFVYNKSVPYDDNGHGTQIAGIIAGKSNEFNGLCPNVNIIGLKVLDINNKGKISDIIDALEWVLDNKDIYKIRIVNISIGFETISSELLETCEKVCEEGIVIVSSAGNHTEAISQGISGRNIIFVGSVECSFEEDKVKKALYSNDADIYTFGSNISTIDSNTTYKGNLEEKIYYTDKYTTVTGTSYSAAIMTGCICNILNRENGKSLNEILDDLFGSYTLIYKDNNEEIPVLKWRK